VWCFPRHRILAEAQRNSMSFASWPVLLLPPTAPLSRHAGQPSPKLTQPNSNIYAIVRRRPAGAASSAVGLSRSISGRKFSLYPTALQLSAFEHRSSQRKALLIFSPEQISLASE
jgi:hypothetical protein